MFVNRMLRKNIWTEAEGSNLALGGEKKRHYNESQMKEYEMGGTCRRHGKD
jgi:hypothetical protein